jgi:hypothetical protein
MHVVSKVVFLEERIAAAVGGVFCQVVWRVYFGPDQFGVGRMVVENLSNPAHL